MCGDSDWEAEGQAADQVGGKDQSVIWRGFGVNLCHKGWLLLVYVQEFAICGLWDERVKIWPVATACSTSVLLPTHH